MKAVRLVEIGKPLELQELAVPEIGAREVLLRVKAAGICHSDAHYRAGASPVGPLPQTLGHEIAGVVEKVGSGVTEVAEGDAACVHYLLTCGDCYYCRSGREQFCVKGSMIGKYVDGGYAEYITVPARNLVPLPEEVSFEVGALLMCSAATSLHALHRARLAPGETVAIFGVGGLGMAAVQLAERLGALRVYAVDINAEKLDLARELGAIPVDASKADPVDVIREHSGGVGVDVSLELVGLPETMAQAVACLKIFGRAAMVAIAEEPLQVDVYRDVICKETEIIGCADHYMHDLELLIEYARRGQLELTQEMIEKVPLEAEPINAAMDALDRFGASVRTVILP
jgi:propanol-preferring alcohol dehydrogenase